MRKFSITIDINYLPLKRPGMSLNNCTLGKDNRYFDSFYVKFFFKIKVLTMTFHHRLSNRNSCQKGSTQYMVHNTVPCDQHVWQYKKNTWPFQTWHQHKSEIIQFHSFSDNNFSHFHKHSWPVVVPFYQTDHHHLPMRMIILVNFLTAWKVWCFAENVH